MLDGAPKVVQIAGWWLLFAPKVVRTSGRCFSFRGSRVALKVVQIAGWWLLFAPKLLDGGGLLDLHRKCCGLLEGFFSFRGSLVALKVVQIAGWWLLFAPKVVRTCGRVFFFSWFPCGTEGGADWWMVAFICTESGTDFWKVFFFSWFPCGTESCTDCRMVAFICTESGTDFWNGGFYWHRKWYGLPEGVFLFVVPVWH